MRVRVLVAFNGMRKGDEGTVSGVRAVALASAYAVMGLLEVIDDGESTAGPGGPAQGDPGGVHVGAAPSGAAGGQPSQDPGPRRYRKAQGSDRTTAVPADVDAAPASDD